MIRAVEQATRPIPDDANAIGGLTMGADPMAYGVAAVLATRAVASTCSWRGRSFQVISSFVWCFLRRHLVFLNMKH